VRRHRATSLKDDPGRWCLWWWRSWRVGGAAAARGTRVALCKLMPITRWSVGRSVGGGGGGVSAAALAQSGGLNRINRCGVRAFSAPLPARHRHGAEIESADMMKAGGPAPAARFARPPGRWRLFAFRHPLGLAWPDVSLEWIVLVSTSAAGECFRPAD
jgi:hypothetical protein